jgi:hypothetical protein
VCACTAGAGRRRLHADTGGRDWAGGGEAVLARGQSECRCHVSHVNARGGHLVEALALLRREMSVRGLGGGGRGRGREHQMD